MKPVNRHSFDHAFAAWSKRAGKMTDVDLTDQLRILNEITDLITPELALEEITATIYANVNHLVDAFQFAVGIYNAKEGTLVYRGMIEDGQLIPDFSVDALDETRFAAWCIRSEKEIFMNDIDAQYMNYVKNKPVPLAGSDPKAAIYVPLKLHDQVVGLVTVRTIRKNVYLPYHLQILKTVGNFIVRALELADVSSQPYPTSAGARKEWKWCEVGKLKPGSRKVLDELTGREKEVLFLLITGLTNKQIAEKLFVSAPTVKSHTLNIYHKLGVANRTAAVSKAMEKGWVV